MFFWAWYVKSTGLFNTIYYLPFAVKINFCCKDKLIKVTSIKKIKVFFCFLLYLSNWFITIWCFQKTQQARCHQNHNTFFMSVTLYNLKIISKLKETVSAPSQKAGVPFQVPSDVQRLTFDPLRMNPPSHPKDTSCGYVVRSPSIDPLAGACNGPQSLAKEWIWIVISMVAPVNNYTSNYNDG